MKILGIIVLCFCLWGCGNIRHIPKLSPENIIKKDYDISQSAKKIRYIPLEAGPENFSCPIKYFIDAGKFYYVTDEYSILKYTSEGEFVCKIGDWGIEPGQYGEFYWMDMTPSFDRLYVRTFDDMYEFDANGRLLGKRTLDAALENSYDRKKRMITVQASKIKKSHHRFYLSTFFITKKNKFLFKNITSIYNDAAILICDKKLDSIGVIKNTGNKKSLEYNLYNKFCTNRKYYFYQEENSDTLCAVTPRLKRKVCLTGIGTPNAASKNVYCFEDMLYNRKSNHAVYSPGGVWMQHILWSPLAGIGNRLFLQTSTYNVIQNKAYITDPELKRISETLTPDSGVVLLEIKIRKLKLK